MGRDLLHRFLVGVVTSVLTLSLIVSPSLAGAGESGNPPELSGEVLVGETISVTLNSWADRTVSYSWLRDETLIRDDDGDILRTSSYTLAESDIRRIISLKIQDIDSSEVVILQTSRVPSPANVSSSVPTIAGSAIVGEELTVNKGNWSDGTSFTYQWFRNGFSIEDATSSTYTVAEEDFGSSISVEVSGALKGRLAETLRSDGTSPVTSDTIVAGVPAPEGQPVVGAENSGCQIRAHEGDWESGTTFKYQWVLIDSDDSETRVPDSFGDTFDHKVFTPTVSQIGSRLALEVKGSKSGKDDRTVRSDVTPEIYEDISIGSCVQERLESIQDPSLNASRTYEQNNQTPRMTVGQSLAVDPGEWPAGTTLEYTWTRNDFNTSVEISRDFNSSSYQLTSEDLSKRIDVRVTARNPGLGLERTSKSLRGYDVFPELEGDRPTISGEEGFGNTLTANTGDWTTEDLQYQWYRNSTTISGATSSTYTVTDADWLSRISVEVTGRVPDEFEDTEFRKHTFSRTSVRSEVLPLATLDSSLPTISGTREVGETLSATTGAWTSGTQFSYQWLRDGVELQGATSQSYSVVLEDATSNVSVRVTGSQEGYDDKTLTSVNRSIQGLSLEAGTPTISGVAEVGETLTVDPGVWTDGTTLTYEWARVGGNVISGATGTTYVVTLDDVGEELQVLVRGNKTYYTTSLRITAETDQIPVPDISGSVPTISGSAALDETLTAVTGAWTDGAALSYQWLRDGEAIDGATSQTYTVVADDVETELAVRVTGSLAGYQSTSLESSRTAPVALKALSSTTPTITGTSEVGETLTATTGSWTDGTSFSYQWLRAGQEITGATNETYEVVIADVGSALSVRVAGSKDGFASTTLDSSATTSVPELTLTSASPTITGTAEVGETLNVSTAGWTTNTSFIYQWLRDGQSIPAATQSSYSPTIDDVGEQISVRVTGSLVGYTSQTLTSTATTSVPELTLNTTTPIISGQTEVGERLTVVPGAWTEATALSYQWKRGGAAVSGATSTSYLVTIDDIGSEITVSVTGRKTGYTSTTEDSKATVSVPVPTVSSAVPTISGLTAVGEVLQATPGDWSDGASFAYQWRRDGLSIAGATSATYQLVESDLDTQISIRIIGEKLGYDSATRDSAQTSPIQRKLETSKPTISGVAEIGSELAADAGSWTMGVSFSFRWLRNGTHISNATSPTYVVARADAGARISVEVTGSLDGFLTEEIVSSNTNLVPRPKATSRPSRDGDLEDDRLPASSPTPAPPGAPEPRVSTATGAEQPETQGDSLNGPTATAQIGGRPVAVNAEVLDNGNLQFSAGSIAVGLGGSSTESSVDESQTIPTLITPVGSAPVLEVSGLLPGSRVDVALPFANGLVAELPPVTAEESGTLIFDIDLSDRALSRPFPVGTHSIRLSGVDEEGDSIVIEFPIRISQSEPSPQLLTASGEQPLAPLGQTTALVAGEPETIEARITTDRAGVSGDGWSMELALSDGAEDESVLSFSSSTPRTVRGSGFLPGTRADVWLFSKPIFIGSAEVDDDGFFVADFTVDESLVDSGAHTLQLQGVGIDGYVRAVNMGVEVVPTSTQLAIEEPSDAFSFWLTAGVAMVLLLVTALIFIAARKARPSHS